MKIKKEKKEKTTKSIWRTPNQKSPPFPMTRKQQGESVWRDILDLMPTFDPFLVSQ